MVWPSQLHKNIDESVAQADIYTNGYDTLLRNTDTLTDSPLVRVFSVKVLMLF